MTERETTLLLVRHGESVVTVRGVMGGEKSCEGLSDLGRRQAAALRDRLERGGEPPVDVLVSSTLPRARETAEIVNEHLGLPIEEHKDLEEHRPGTVDGARFSDISQQWEAFDYIGRRHDRVAEGAESASEFFFRVSRAFEEVLAAHKGKTVFVACHGGVIDVAFRTFLDLPARGHFDLFTLNTSITELRVNDHGPRRGRWRLLRYNDHAHLAGLPAETPREAVSRAALTSPPATRSPRPDGSDDARERPRRHCARWRCLRSATAAARRAPRRRRLGDAQQPRSTQRRQQRPCARRLHGYLDAVERRDDVRVVVLRGAGRGFCAGLDLKDRPAASEAPGQGAGYKMLTDQRRWSQLVVKLRRIPQPVVALVHGSAAGLGMSLALAADIRIAGESARFNAAFIRIGFGGGDCGSSYLLPRLVGSSVARELLMTGRFCDAERSLRIGLVSEVVPDDELTAAGEALVADLSTPRRPACGSPRT